MADLAYYTRLKKLSVCGVCDEAEQRTWFLELCAIAKLLHMA
jgi:hypothetical protein